MDIVNVINLQRRTDRLLSVTTQAKQQGFPILVWEGVEGNLKPQTNISLAHKQIIKHAKENNHEYCFIAEDDLIFTSPNGWKYYREQMPPSFDLYFSMLYSADIIGNRVVNGFSGLTLYCVHNRFYNFFLSLTDDIHLDRNLGIYCHEKEYLICQPYVAKQSGGYSDNSRTNQSYSVYEDELVFYDK